ncbi:zinc metalloproteinase nas-15 [Folsomia candida]|nr:zinc metalloproteinase nas-15 [Folsomia candida]
MDIWRFWQVLYIVGLAHWAQCHSDPLDTSESALFDEQAHVPGEPLTPIDYQNAESVGQSSPPNDQFNSDPIELAGLFEGDIILSTTMRNLGNESSEDYGNRNGIIYEKQKWPAGVVPYFISSQFNAVERSVIAKAISEYHANTCIKFKPRTSETDYIHITKGNGCSSLVGRAGGAQPVTLGQGCVYTGIAIHELMHAVGFWHEQSRFDRDDHVNVYFQNIQSGMEFNFRKYTWNYIQNLSAPYDLSSVMHYGSYAFSKDRRSATILPKDPNKKIGQRDNFSKIDILKINRLYQCDNVKPTSTPPPTPKPITACEDNHKHCAYWAASKGECVNNSAWMLVNCKKSCKQCDKPCEDLNQYCGVWAKRGDCTRSSEYMKSYCSKSCRTCKTNGGAGGSVGAPEPHPNMECDDKEKYCMYWASRDECSKNPKFMGKYCPKSCKLC